ncbi:uncharacterized protein BJ171DRAFT_505700 [Polychytrium aggregatum]|uniref:uncharacterized protein n=1 Tax=Polychytrium aggregatum TaxID=110093 RepID=UPI0022FEF069|nr:uncharacterized protein BJ171DRAFT_505700 [Polychytrium aggregatum]KAI9204398.1 hypothetical protein BJ171DRAFT_505700 [Polychytrium aggregatum]
MTASLLSALVTLSLGVWTVYSLYTPEGMVGASIVFATLDLLCFLPCLGLPIWFHTMAVARSLSGSGDPAGGQSAQDVEASMNPKFDRDTMASYYSDGTPREAARDCDYQASPYSIERSISRVDSAMLDSQEPSNAAAERPAPKAVSVECSDRYFSPPQRHYAKNSFFGYTSKIEDLERELDRFGQHLKGSPNPGAPGFGLPTQLPFAVRRTC